MTAMLGIPAAEAAAWHGRLHLGFARQDERTTLVDRRVCMPLAIQRPFYPEGPQVCHVLLLHPPGGLVSGDRLEVRLDLQAASEVLVTTPAAGKWYRGERWRAGEPLWIDRQQLAGGSRLLDRAYGLAGEPVIGTLVWIGKAVTPELVDKARQLSPALAARAAAGVTRLPWGLLCRYRGPSSSAARQWFTAVWDLLRREYRARAAQTPRIWNT